MVLSWLRQLLSRRSLKDLPRWKRVKLYAELLEDRTLPSGDFGFAFALGDTKSDEGRAITCDSAGNIYVTGGFTGTVNFNPGGTATNLTSSSNSFMDVFVA